MRLDERYGSRHEARAAQRWQPALALLVAAAVGDREREERRRQHRQRDREIAPRELLGDQRAGDGAALAASAVALADRVADQAELVRGVQRRRRQLPRLVAVARVRPQLVRRELADGAGDQLLLLGRLEIDQRSLSSSESRPLGSTTQSG
jgi:hypothetical protein